MLVHSFSHCSSKHHRLQQSMIYTKSGGRGKASSLAVAAGTTLLFFIGPDIASYLPRCMAGTLLLHCGLDLFSEGVYDSYGNYDYLEYSGIWAIVIVMTMFGMEAALMAGAISALLTYAIQSVAYPKPIRCVGMPCNLATSIMRNRLHLTCSRHGM